MEQTLILFKPDAIQRQLVGEIITRFEKVGLRIVGMKMIYPDRDHYYKHYEDIGKMISRRGEKAFEVTLDFMLKGPVIAVVLEGVEAVALVRKMVGDTDPKVSAPGTIRGDFTHMSLKHATEKDSSIPNVLHASGDAKEAKAEISHWFDKDELFEYKTLHQKYTH